MASQANPLPSFLSLPIVKFSWATTAPDADKEVSWSHSHDANMCLVFDTAAFGSGPSSSSASPHGKLLKVFRDTTLLESIDLTYLSALAAAELSHARRHGHSLPQNQLAIACIVRSPCIALRYRLGPTTIRRIQVKLTAPTDYPTALRALESTGLPISHTPASSSGAAAARHHYVPRPATAPVAPPPQPGLRSLPYPSAHEGSRPGSALDLPPLPTPTFTPVVSAAPAAPVLGRSLSSMLHPPASTTPALGAGAVTTLGAAAPRTLGAALAGAGPAAQVEAELHAYAAHPASDRARLIDELIVRCLRDEGFVSLCEDVEAAWRRVGLGF